MEKQLRVLVVLPMYGGSLPIGRYCIEALKELGHSVRVFEAPVFYNAFTALRTLDLSPEQIAPLEHSFLQIVSQAVFAHVQAFEPHLVFCLAQAPMGKNLLQRLRRLGIRTCMWFVEDYTLFTYWKLYAPLYDVFCVIQKEPFLSRLREIGQKNALYLPLAALPLFHSPLSLTPEEKRIYGASIAFLGAGYPNRRIAFRALLGKDFKIWGSDWDGETVLKEHIQRNGERISEDEARKIYAATTLNLNLHSSVHIEELVSHGDFVNPRTFELACMGAFQLVDRRSLMPELFGDDELATFASLEEMLALIDFYLHHPEERAHIAQKSRERVLKDHTYAKRMEEMLGFVEKSAGFPVFEKDVAKPRALQAEIDALLHTLGAGPSADFEEVVARLRRQQGRLSELETSILFLDEFQKQYCSK